VWRAGANVSTRIKTEVPLVIGGKTVPPGEYSLFIELKQPAEWTFIVSSWAAATKYDLSNKEALYGAFNYTPDKDITRAPMKVESLPFRVEQLEWKFLDMTDKAAWRLFGIAQWLRSLSRLGTERTLLVRQQQPHWVRRYKWNPEKGKEPVAV
jgi:hypothetical protein